MVVRLPADLSNPEGCVGFASDICRAGQFLGAQSKNYQPINGPQQLLTRPCISP